MRRALRLALAVLVLCAAPAAAGADEDAAEPTKTDDYGFEEDEAGTDDYGFGDDEGGDDGFDEAPADDERGAGAADSEPAPFERSFWDLSGDLSLGSSYNYLQHQSATGTPYGNLSRLRTQLDLQLDLELPWSWEARIAGYGFYDWVYLFKGRSQYTGDVLDDYEWEVDFKEVWVQGTVAESVDLKLGRQIVNWGRSDTVRVLDVLNPLDNREPGVVDIEDLRLPVTMARVDWYPRFVPRDWGEWKLQLLVVPEFRQDRNPSFGNDFNPTPRIPGIGEPDPPSDKPHQFFDEPEYGAALSGIFSGWDVSLYAARIYLNQPVVTQALGGLLQRYPLVTMVGGGGNLTWGSWLAKGEIAWFHGVEYAQVDDPDLFPPQGRFVDKDRLDWMVGLEYYGVSDLSVAVEIVHRHIFDYDSRMRVEIPGFPVPIAYAKEDTFEGAFRVTWDLLRQTLHLTGVALVVGKEADLGSVFRFEAAYDLIDALTVTGGIVLYDDGQSPAFKTIDSNDRLFVRIEYSF